MLTIPLGPFQLDRLIGVGGAGEVWRGIHVEQNVRVAVKVITAARARRQKYVDAFRNEVRAVAGLEHPGVVKVFDLGIVDEDAEQRSLGRMVAGSPYLAMELATKGSLRTAPLPATWLELRGMLLWLLDVLAHAHACGVIHRDLKPGNVLVFKDPEMSLSADPTGASRLRLTDFGLAHAANRAERAIKGTSGTPIFMAPEQFRGQWREFGPWTDLYALGCMAYTLAAGKPPFRGKGISALMHAHLSEAPPPIEARVPVPDGFDEWIARLIAKDPSLRYQRAADAAWGLIRLGTSSGEADPAYGMDSPPTSATIAGHTLTRSWPDWEKTWTDLGIEETDPQVTLDGLGERLVPPLPTTWRQDLPEGTDMRLVGAGLGLYGLRAIPLIGRDRERDRIWSGLHAVRKTGDVRMVVLRGAAGTGKSRLAEWMTRRADEVGNAIVLRAVHSRGGGAADGISPMIAAALGCTGMDRPELRQRVEQWLRARGVEDDYEWRALTELMWPSRDDSGGDVIRFGGANERYAVIQRLLARLGGGPDVSGVRRPVLVWLDDVQWGYDALGFARYLLDRVSQDTPVLMLLTARRDELEARPVERELMEKLYASDRVDVVDIEPLDDAERHALVEELLFLEGDLADQVVERTGGNPLFAVQLVGDWVQRGVLEVGKTGFVLRRGERAPLPDDIHQLWEERVQTVLSGLPEDGRNALELAALMGTAIDEAEWRGSCAVARLTVPVDLTSALFARRLARHTEQGWEFAHGMLRESLERSAAESGRAPALHDACATTLRIRYDVARGPGIAARLGRHLYLAERPEEALEPLQTGSAERRAQSDYAGAMALLDMRHDVMQELGLDSSDPRWGEGWVLRADLLIGQGRLEEAERFAIRGVQSARSHQWPHVLAPALRHAGTAAAKQGRIQPAEELLQQGRQAAADNHDEREVARCLQFLGDVYRLTGRHDDALKLCRQALGRFSALQDLRGQADVMAGLAAICLARKDLPAAERYLREGIALFQQLGVRYGEGVAHNTLGDVLRDRGQTEDAEQAYRTAHGLLQSLGSPEYLIPELNLAQLLIARRTRVSEARALLEQVLASMQASGRRAWQGALHCFLLPCVAMEGDWAGWGDHVYEAMELLEECGFVDADIANAAELAAEEAEAAGMRNCARDAWQICEAQWKGLGNEERRQQIVDRIAALDAS